MPLGPNLLDAASSTFETGTGGDWEIDPSAMGSSAFSVSSADAHSGTKSMRFDCTNDSYYGLFRLPLPVESGKRYVFGGYTRKAAGGVDVQMLAHLPDFTSAMWERVSGWKPFITQVYSAPTTGTIYATLYVGPNVAGNQIYLDDLFFSEVPPGAYIARNSSVNFWANSFAINPSILSSPGGINLRANSGQGLMAGATATIAFVASPPSTTVDGATGTVSFSVTSGTPTVSPPPTVSGATAEFSLNVTPGVFTNTGPVVVALGATALMVLSSPAATPYIPADLNALGATAQMTLVAYVSGIITPSVPGDFRAAPIPITYTNLSSVNVQAFHPNLYTSTVEGDEPAPGVLAATVWYSIWSNRPLTITASFSGAVSALDLFDSLFRQVSYSGSFSIQANTLYYLRAGAVTPSGVAEFILTAVPVLSTATIDGGTVNYLPGTITINGGGFPPNMSVTVSMSGGTIATVMSDATGSIVPTDIHLIAPLVAGTYGIEGDAGSVHATGTLTVLNDPLPLAVTPPTDTAPSIPSGSRWLLHDPYTGVGVLPDFTFVTNPSEMGSPHAPQNFLVDKTTAGVPHIWEGATRAYEWTFTGILETHAEFDALANYRKIGRRFYLRDHRNRIWTVTFTGLDVQPLRVYPALLSGMHVSEVLRHAPWAHKYTVQVLVYSGPVDAT